MIASNDILLFSLKPLLQVDILVWLAALPLLAAFIILLFYQYRQHRLLKEELMQLAKINRHSVEYDLVMKAMKVSVWRIDVPSRTITYESDYRDVPNSQYISAGSDVEMFCNTLVPKDKQQVTDGMMKLLAGHIDEYHGQYQLKDVNGESGWGETYAIIEKRDMDGKPLVVVGASMRIDKQKAIEQALIDARNHAEESDRLKSAFLANMSHEIRTPLNAIVGFSDVLTMAETEKERNELIALIKKNNAHLLRLFDDMVNMSRLEAGGGTLNKTRFELNTLLQEVADRFSGRAQKAGLKILVETLPDSPQLLTDRNRLGEILDKYMDNALKFTATGSITLGCEELAGRWRIWVRDTGKGIPENRCNEQLFERFVKLDEFVPGTGLGLSICRSLALSMGGTVGVSSAVGKGSTFWVEITA